MIGKKKMYKKEEFHTCYSTSEEMEKALKPFRDDGCSDIRFMSELIEIEKKRKQRFCKLCLRQKYKNKLD